MRRTFQASSGCSSHVMRRLLINSWRMPNRYSTSASPPGKLPLRWTATGSPFHHGSAIDKRDGVVIFRSRLPLPGADLTSPPVRSLLVLNAGILREAPADCFKVTICSRVHESPRSRQVHFRALLWSPLNFGTSGVQPLTASLRKNLVERAQSPRLLRRSFTGRS